MKQNLLCGLLVALLLTSSISAYAQKIGDHAPEFQATDSNGQTHKLSEYRGKFVVLEWHNNGCPVHKETLRKREHATPAEGMDRSRRHLVYGDLLRTRATSDFMGYHFCKCLKQNT